MQQNISHKAVLSSNITTQL